jgi:hypothetical protein
MLSGMSASATRSILAAAAIAAATATFFAQTPRRVTVIAYGDTRFTEPSNVTATNPRARAALVDRIDAERPDAILVSGDLPWHGGTVDDYARFTAETAQWRRHHLRVLPALGNHEFSQCMPDDCLEHWWSVFPEFRGRRWYARNISSNVLVIALDTMSPLMEGSDQRAWLEGQLAGLSSRVQFVLVTLHHPPVADIQTRLRVDHNPRPNEIALAEFLKSAAQSSHARFVVVAGHIHNYERFLQDDIVYLVSGGGGAVPYEVERTPVDLYQGIDFPNYHYVKMTVTDGRLTGEMYRLDEAAAPSPHFTLKDKFELNARGIQLEGTR